MIFYKPNSFIIVLSSIVILFCGQNALANCWNYDNQAQPSPLAEICVGEICEKIEMEQYCLDIKGNSQTFKYDFDEAILKKICKNSTNVNSNSKDNQCTFYLDDTLTAALALSRCTNLSDYEDGSKNDPCLYLEGNFREENFPNLAATLKTVKPVAPQEDKSDDEPINEQTTYFCDGKNYLYLCDEEGKSLDEEGKPLKEETTYVCDGWISGPRKYGYEKTYQYLCDGEGKPLGGLNYVCDRKSYTIFHIGNGWALLNEPDLVPRTTALGFALENKEGEYEREFYKLASGADVMTVYGESGKQYDCVFSRNGE